MLVDHFTEDSGLFCQLQSNGYKLYVKGSFSCYIVHELIKLLCFFNINYLNLKMLNSVGILILRYGVSVTVNTLYDV